MKYLAVIVLLAIAACSPIKSPYSLPLNPPPAGGDGGAASD